MTQNDVGHWQKMNAASAVEQVASAEVPTYAYQSFPPTDGIILDQKVLVGLVLILGIIVGITFILVVDKYHSK
jgi:hypothetical protein